MHQRLATSSLRPWAYILSILGLECSCLYESFRASVMTDLFFSWAYTQSRRINACSSWEEDSTRDRALYGQLLSARVTTGLRVSRRRGWHCCDAILPWDKCGCNSANCVGMLLMMWITVSRVDACWLTTSVIRVMGISDRSHNREWGVWPRAVAVARCSCLTPG